MMSEQNNASKNKSNQGRNGPSNRGGRGRGRGRGRGGGNRGRGSGHSSPSSISPSMQQRRSHLGSSSRGGSATSSRSSTPTVVKQNGERGAEAHTVSEDERIRFTQMLVNMRENETVNRIEMPTDLTNTERKFIHQLATQLGLKSKSHGKGEERRIVIHKMEQKKRSKKYDDSENDNLLPLLKVPGKAVSALQNHVQSFPPSDLEYKESILTGSSIIDTLSSQTNHSNKSSQSNDSFQDDFNEDLLQALDNIATVKNDSQSKTPNRKKYLNVTIDPEQRSLQYHSAQTQKMEHPAYKNALKGRKNLPAYNFQNQIRDVVMNNRVTLISGDTGCGKSTQIPQFILDDPNIGPSSSIVVTQPRRISAISIADRIASERCEEVGGMVGYQVRLEGCASKRTQLLFLTPGVLLKKFQSSPDLQEFTHVIIDEIHERDRYTEFLLIALRDLMSRRNDLRIILMSATIQTHELMEYWSSLNNLDTIHENISGNPYHMNRPAEISIPGRTYPVQEFFLEDILQMTGFVDNDSARFGNGNGQMDMELLNSILCKTERGNGDKNKKANKTHSSSSITTNVLSCVMCGKTGFICAEELGSHVALCDGGGDISMEELEDKVRSINFSSISNYCNKHGSQTNKNLASTDTKEQLDEYKEYDDEEYPQLPYVDDDDNDDNDENDIPGLSMEKWDGVSPFGVTDMLTTNKKATLTEEELLNRYQVTHDDEQVDYDLVLEVMKFVNRSSYGTGAILIFFPGWQEISEFGMLLESTHPFSDITKFSVLPLHSGIPSKDQRKVFIRPPTGVRKIVLATNIAETSITIDDVAFVIDSGRAKEKNYDPHLKTSTLQPVWVSKASARQRKGRAGRTKAGVCFHLFSRRRHESMKPFLESELLRTPLEEMCLQCKKLELAPGGQDESDGIPSFLAKALTPPHPKSIQNALDLLVDLGAMVDETNDLTELGQCLSVLSLEPRVGKMVIWSYILGCSGAATSMGVAMSYKSPFVLPPNSMRQKADQIKVAISEGSESDQMTILNVLKARDNFYRRNKQSGFSKYCRSNFLNLNTVQMVSDLRRNIGNELASLGFPAPSASNPKWHNRNNYANPAFLQATIAAGLYPNVGTRVSGEINFNTISNQKAKVHMSSVNACKGQPLSSKCQIRKREIEFIVFGELVKGVSSFTMNQTSHLPSPMPLLLMCGNLRVRPASEENNSVLSIDNWITFLCPEDTASAIVILRKRLEKSFAKIVSNPHDGLNQLHPNEKAAVDTLSAVLKCGWR